MSHGRQRYESDLRYEVRGKEGVDGEYWGRSYSKGGGEVNWMDSWGLENYYILPNYDVIMVLSNVSESNNQQVENGKVHYLYLKRLKLIKNLFVLTKQLLFWHVIT